MRMTDLKPGWTVLANDGHRLGTIRDVGQNYVLVSRAGRSSDLLFQRRLSQTWITQSSTSTSPKARRRKWAGSSRRGTRIHWRRRPRATCIGTSDEPTGPVPIPDLRPPSFSSAASSSGPTGVEVDVARVRCGHRWSGSCPGHPRGGPPNVHRLRRSVDGWDRS